MVIVRIVCYYCYCDYNINGKSKNPLTREKTHLMSFNNLRQTLFDCSSLSSRKNTFCSRPCFLGYSSPNVQQLLDSRSRSITAFTIISLILIFYLNFTVCINILQCNLMQYNVTFVSFFHFC